MSIFIKNNKGQLVEHPPYPCKLCGQYEIEFPHDICKVCGWQDDGSQEWPDENCGANHLTYNQYKYIWETHKERILSQAQGKGSLVREIFNKQK